MLSALGANGAATTCNPSSTFEKTAKHGLARRSSRLRVKSATQQTPPQEKPQDSRRRKLERALNSLNIPGRQAAQRLQQRASEVDSKKVSAAISRLLKSWQASDEEEATLDSSYNNKHNSPKSGQHKADEQEQAALNADVHSNGSAQVMSSETEQQQQPEQDAKRNRLLSLFGRGRAQQQPEELLPLRGNHPALQLLRQRAAQNSLPNDRHDKFKLGLVVEGGGMRGAVSAGALLELGNLGFRECFDAVYGSSAGAINATYFLTGQREGVSIYYDDIANKTFMDLSRLLDKNKHQGPVLNLSFLIDDVMERVKPLYWDAVIEAPIPLKVVASCLDSLEPILLEGFESKEDLVACLKASANVPRIAGDPVQHRGLRLVDAAVFEAVPFRVAIADGCTHIITLCTRPPYKGNRIRKAVNNIFTDAIKRAVMSPTYMKDAWRRELEIIAEDGLTPEEMLVMALEEGSETMPFFSGCSVYPIFPGAASKYPPVCIDADIIRKGVEEGQMAVRRAITPYAGIVPPTASSTTPESSKASEAQSLQSLESLASCDLDSSLDSDEDVVQEKDQTMLQEQYKWLVEQRNALQKQLAELGNGQTNGEM